MDFVGNQAWFIALLVLHTLGAIIGIGPAFTFGILGARAEKAGPEGSVALIGALHAIEMSMLAPTVRFIQWTTGVGLIFNRGLNNEFFSSSRAWLIVSIAIYAVLLVLGEVLYAPNTRKLYEAAQAGDTAEVAHQAGLAKKIGPIAPLLTIVIIVLMVWKPGSGCPTLSC
jgi:p-aminobenzoyl-glutamate transporter AbgT